MKRVRNVPTPVLSILFCLISFGALGSFCWGQNKPIRMPIQRPAPLPSPKPEQIKEPAVPPMAPTPGPAVDFEMEMKKLQTLIQLNSKNATAYFNRGCLFEYKGDHQKAIEDYSKAIELDKEMKDAYFNRGVVFTSLKKYEEALKDFSELIRIEPTADAYCNRGCIYFQTSKLDLALADYNEGLKVRPNDSDLLYNRALVYLAKGDKGAADEDLKVAARQFHDKTRREFPDLAPAVPAQLKKAALEGQIMEFNAFMPDDLRQRVQGFEAARAKVEKALQELENKAKQILGKKFKRQGDTLAFSIVGSDPGWTEIFGPQWPQLIRKNPNELRFFHMSFEFAWKEEIPVLQRLEACLENPSYCQDMAPPNSAIHLKRVGGVWMLSDGKTPDEWKQVQAYGDGLVGLIQWAEQYLTENKGRMTEEEMLLGMARAYMQKIMALTNKPKPAGKSL